MVLAGAGSAERRLTRSDLGFRGPHELDPPKWPIVTRSDWISLRRSVPGCIITRTVVDQIPPKVVCDVNPDERSHLETLIQPLCAWGLQWTDKNGARILALEGHQPESHGKDHGSKETELQRSLVDHDRPAPGIGTRDAVGSLVNDENMAVTDDLRPSSVSTLDVDIDFR